MQSTSLDSTSHTKDENLPSIDNLAGLPPAEFDAAVKPLREYFKQFDEDGELSQLMLVDNITNHIVDGLYVRELLLPKGSLVLSRVHKKPLVNIISKGLVHVIDTNGHKVYEAPATFTSPAGTQRLVFAEEETVWNTAHAHSVSDEANIVDELTSDNYVSYTQQLQHKE